jgi:GABA permease
MVVAHRTLVEDHLLDHVRGLCVEGCTFHLVVPVTHPMGKWSEGQIEAAAEAKLEEGEAAFRAIGAEVSGEVGDANPVYAVAAALRERPDEDWAGIIVSTLPPGISRWLGLDAVSRIKREFDLPVTHLVAERATAEA